MTQNKQNKKTRKPKLNIIEQQNSPEEVQLLLCFCKSGENKVLTVSIKMIFILGDHANILDFLW